MSVRLRGYWSDANHPRSMYNVQARSITHPNVVLGLALGYGGLVQLIAGIEEWACGNSFGATAVNNPFGSQLVDDA